MDLDVQAEEPRRRRARLSRELVLETAVKLADADGIESVTMRRLAEAVGGRAMSLYYHAANKEDLLAGMLDVVVREMEPTAVGTDWKAAVRANANSRHEVLERHPWAAELLMSSARPGPAYLGQMDALLACLTTAGFRDAQVDYAFHAIDIYVLGFALWEAQLLAAMSRGSMHELASGALAAIRPEDLPHVAEHIAFHLRIPPGQRLGTFEFGLDLVLDGLARTLDANA